MAKRTSDTNPEGVARLACEAGPRAEIRAWFIREVLPLEATLTHFLCKNWRNKSDIEDFRQEVYENVLLAAETKIPDRTKPFLFMTARNLLINRLQKESVVAMEVVADLDALGAAADEPGPDRTAFARDMLRRLQAALDSLPPKCREALVLKRIEGLSQREIAQRMGISEQSVANHVARGVGVLAEMVYGQTADPRSSA
jgi:RNA polymerase sigma factor (sigma-70 family)